MTPGITLSSRLPGVLLEVVGSCMALPRCRPRLVLRRRAAVPPGSSESSCVQCHSNQRQASIQLIDSITVTS